MSPRQQVTPEMIDRWLESFASPHTRSAYRADLAGFTAWCDSLRTSPLTADAAVLEQYRQHHEAAGASAASVARRISALNGFFRFAVHAGVRPASPAAESRPPVVLPSSTIALSAAEREALLASLPAQAPSTQLLVALLLLDGMKLDEALGLDRSDLGSYLDRSSVDRAHLDSEQFAGHPSTTSTAATIAATVTTRGHQRTIVLHPHTTTLVRRQLIRRRAGTGGDGPVFVSGARNATAGRRLSRFGADAWLKKAGRDAGLEQPLTSNVLRRTHVQHAQRSGQSVDTIRRRLGHDDARTTRRYLDTDATPTHNPH